MQLEFAFLQQGLCTWLTKYFNYHNILNLG